MNGTILMELRKYVGTKFGADAWERLLHEAGIGAKIYVPVEEYPDDEALSLLTAASKMAAMPVSALLEDFGEFIVPDFVKMYGFLIAPEWKTIDLIANTERTIHEVLRRANPKSKPPRLQCARRSEQAVDITYTSPRKMCSLAKGLARGIAKNYHEQIAVTERTCMLTGGAQCDISVTLVP